MSIPSRYDPFSIEEKWYRFWEEKGLFSPAPQGKKFSITIPPPNVTGSLHMGHALNYTLQDIVIRFKRMQGYSALCLPGTDHAGIATQYVVEKELAKEKKTRFDIGKQAFLEMLWEWKEKYGNTIINQFKRMGYSFDWSRLRFTLDEDYSRAVRVAFVTLFQKGYIYKGKRMVNWCPRCQTSLSDLEVESREEETTLYYIKYPSENGAHFITVATTRPETLLGDVAVAVHPDDERYKDLVGKLFVLPFTGRLIPLITDPFVDPEFGTGAVKITPAHDMNDYEVAMRHKLEPIVIMDKRGKITKVKHYKGLDRFEARAKIVKELEKVALLEKQEPYKTVIGHCYRCGSVIEPYLSEQWFIRMEELARPAIEALEQGLVQIIPERFASLLVEWFKGIKDWCVSRQIWWGHPIPIYQCTSCKEYSASVEDLERCPKCGGPVKQEEGVLDTWFSSALWPFATLGWPKETEDLQRFYPTDILFTARDILYLWVGRMIMMGLEFMKEVPFHKVYVHPTILTEEGKRMSKSLGTGIDPLQLVEKYGADAVRFGLAVQSTTGQDLRFSTNRIEMARTFCNKIWNAARFVLLNTTEADSSPIEKPTALFDRWILSKLHRCIDETTRALENYDFDTASLAIYNFFWDDFCDWYIEVAKKRIKEAPVRSLLQEVLGVSLRLLHPFMPHLTEEIWQKLPHKGESICLAPWPCKEDYPLDEEAEERVRVIQELIKSVRNVLRMIGASSSFKPALYIQYDPDVSSPLSKEELDIIKSLCALKSTKVVEAPPQNRYIREKVGNLNLFIEVKELKHLMEEAERVEKQLEKVEEELKKVEAKLNNPEFLSRAPQKVLEKQRGIREEYLEEKKILLERLSLLKEVLRPNE